VRVLLITDWPASPGGTEVYVDAVRAGLSAAGDEVRLLTSSVGSAAHGTADFVAYGSTNVAAQAVLQIVNPFAMRRARQAVAEFQPDVALIFMFAYHLSPAVFWALGAVPAILMALDYKIICPLGSKLLPTGEICAHRAGVPCVTSGCLSIPHWMRDQIRYASISHAIRRSSLVLTCSRHMERTLRANGVDAEALELPVAPPTRSFRRRPAAHPQFVFSGRIAPEKGVPQLVNAFARVAARVPNARLTICGDGRVRGDVEAAIRANRVDDSVSLTGWLDPIVVERHLEDAWALVAPAIWAEPLGLVVPEAIVRGVPVIASRIGGFSETVEEERSGLLATNGDEASLADALERVATGRAFPDHSLGPAIVARARELHSVERHISRLRLRLQSVVVAPRRSA